MSSEVTGLTVICTPEGDVVFEGRINAADFQRVRLDPLERKLLNDVKLGHGPHEYLLALEVIFRRMAEQGVTPELPDPTTLPFSGTTTGREERPPLPQFQPLPPSTPEARRDGPWPPKPPARPYQ